MPETAAMNQELPYLGLGLRLRREYIPALLTDKPEVDWFEVISECYLDADQEKLAELEALREHYPIVLHGISLGIGSPWPLDRDYLQKLKRLIERIRPTWISDHLCWSGADDIQGQLLPLPYSKEMIDHVVPRIHEVQEFLGCPLLLENVPIEEIDPKTELAEADFIREVAVESDSRLLIDLESLHTTCVNQDSNPMDYLSHLPTERVQQIHLAGATILCNPEEPTHPLENPNPIWQLYMEARRLFGPLTTMIERLDTIPSLTEMVQELEKARCALATD